MIRVTLGSVFSAAFFVHFLPQHLFGCLHQAGGGDLFTFNTKRKSLLQALYGWRSFKEYV